MSYGGNDLNLEATELRLGLPGRDEHEKQSSPSARTSNKRASPEVAEESSSLSNSNVSDARNSDRDSAPPAK